MNVEVPGIVGWIIVGLVAGWLASKIMGSRRGLIGSFVLGIVGALVGGFLFSVLGIGGATNIVGSIVIATVGAVIVLAVVNQQPSTRLQDRLAPSRVLFPQDALAMPGRCAMIETASG